MQCPACHTSVLPDDQFCEECGTALKPSQSIACAKCGGAIDAEGFCSDCGFRGEIPPVEVLIDSKLAGVSDRGLKHHQNEDFLALQATQNTQILVVCDGVSSADRPELAAQKASKTACLTLAALSDQPPLSALKSAVSEAFSAVFQLPSHPGLEPPSTTLVAAIVQNRVATIAWLGDSRAYWISPNGSRQLTQDHSWINRVIASGEMTESEAQQSSQAHAITRWIGADAKDDADPEIIEFIISENGCLILCTDGLWNYAPDAQQISDLIQRNDALSISRTLVKYARSRGGHDNITVAVLQVNEF
jgi:serine/threonine protein phosphatase PrpC/predicted nucleic acid-binding Zn ribbon protein